MAIIKVKVPGVSHSAEGTTVSLTALSNVLKGVGALENLFSQYNVVLNGEITFGEGEVLVNHGEPKKKGLPMPQNEMCAAVTEAHGFIEDVKQRFGHAYDEQESIERKPMERQVLAFNKAAFALAAAGGSYVLLPETAFERQYVPADRNGAATTR